jgi:hypothetical protein
VQRARKREISASFRPRNAQRLTVEQVDGEG